jgi:hypothetical protein
MNEDDRILKKHNKCDGVLDIDNDELDIFFSSTEDDEILDFDNRRGSSYSPRTFRSNSISPPYSVSRRSPSSYTFISNESNRSERKKRALKQDRQKRMERQRKLIEAQRINNATKKIQSAYRKHLSKKNKGNDCCAMMGGKNNEKDCGCGIMGGKRKTKRRWSRKYKKSINCRNPKGFSQKQYCKYGRKKSKRSKKMRGGFGGYWKRVSMGKNNKDAEGQEMFDYKYVSNLDTIFGRKKDSDDLPSARNLITYTKSLEQCKKGNLPGMYNTGHCDGAYNSGKDLFSQAARQLVIQENGKLVENPDKNQRLESR